MLCCEFQELRVYEPSKDVCTSHAISVHDDFNKASSLWDEPHGMCIPQMQCISLVQNPVQQEALLKVSTVVSRRLQVPAGTERSFRTLHDFLENSSDKMRMPGSRIPLLWLRYRRVLNSYFF